MDTLKSQLNEWNRQGLTINQICQYTGIANHVVRYWYRKTGIDYIPDIKRWDISRFMNANDIDAQYVIGFLAADGYLDGHKLVGVYVQEKDIEIIYRIISVFNRQDKCPRYRYPVGCQPQVGINIGSVELVNFLITVYGFSNSKSFTIPFPRHLSNPLPFLRGFMDGDGYMGVSCTFTTASIDFANGLLEWVYRVYGYQPAVTMTGVNRNIYNINFRKKHSLFINDLFSYPGLARKTEAYMRYLPN